MKMKIHIPVIMARIGRKEYPMGIDCGATSCLLDMDMREKVEKQTRNSTSANLTGASQNAREVSMAQIKKLKIGKDSFDNMTFVFSSIAHLRNAGVPIDGLLGYEFLSRQKTILSFGREELLLVH